ncbi:hypothetical protein KUTeg_016839 [Tegillarca granosa]|uniref:SNF2 N-terminal domain-containing protein n=1 Tax=Tegillarca granosa TaxID=220873 RepID=A0ABQ9EM48_TEGGR|nr:hypothetical protein KUTeg_016839 [Tegillarca granosa]
MTYQSKIVHSKENMKKYTDKQAVWCKGERCLAPWSGDGNLYNGVIKQINRHGINSVTASVQFDDYPDDDWEEICLTKLKIIPKKKKSKNGWYIVLGIYVKIVFWHYREKYSRLDYDSDDGSLSATNSSVNKKSVVATGRTENTVNRTRTNKTKENTLLCLVKRLTQESGNNQNVCSHIDIDLATPGASSTKPSHDMHTNDSNVDNDQNNHSCTNKNDLFDEKQDEIEGFDDEDMEKPKFKFTPSAAKIPYLLSEPGKTPVIQVPSCINQYLRDYQRKVKAEMSENAKLLEDYKDVISSPFLIIGPGSLLYNWMDEFEAWGYFTVGKYHGADKAQCLVDLRKGKFEIIVTTFETFRDNFDEMNSLEWAAGLKAQTTRALRSIDTVLRYGLTGTALQNSMEELWCILDCVRCQPDSLGSLFVFKEEFIIPIEKGLKNDATKHELAIARKKKESFAKMRSTMMIRRTKNLISDQLPQKDENVLFCKKTADVIVFVYSAVCVFISDDNVVFCKMTDLQIGVYKEILNHAGIEFVMTMDDPCTCGSGLIQKHCHKETPDGSTVTSLMFTFMHLLLKTANHVALLTPDKATNDKLSHCSKEVCQNVFEKFPEFFNETKEATFKTLSNPKFCGKMKVTLKVVQRLTYSMKF